MLIEEIYEKYKIPPQLRYHQLQVAAVAKVIIDNIDQEINKQSILTACLLHDMGNIIKFDLESYPAYLEPEGLDYWLKVQQDFIDKYGNNEHKATYEIVKEVGVNKNVLYILDNIGFANAKFVAESDNYALKISTYADQRINFGEVVDMRERHVASRERYLKRRNIDHAVKGANFDELSDAWREIEKQIFGKCRIKPEEINDERVGLTIVELRSFDVRTSS